MDPKTFTQLCEKLRSIDKVKDSTRATIEEQVAKFLHIIGHNVPRTNTPRFHERKDYSTQNVFVTFNFDMKFTYIFTCMGRNNI
ncbi:hypothetical protein CR513_22842, partial [Mucuna pruriens]